MQIIYKKNSKDVNEHKQKKLGKSSLKKKYLLQPQTI